MIKIVHIAMPLSGVGVYIKLLSENLNPNEFKNYIFCNKNDENLEIYDGNNQKVEEKHIDIYREINFFNDFKCYKQISELLKEVEPDLVHCHSAKAGIIGRLAALNLKIPSIYTPHAFSYLSAENTLKKLLFKSIEKSFKYSSSKILACSGSEYNRAIEELKFPTEKVLVWKNSINNVVQKKKVQFIEDLPKEYICTIGRPSYQKNTELLIETIYRAKKEISNIHLVILGIGLFSPSLQKVKNLIVKLNISKNVTLLEWVNREDSLSILENSLFFVSSSRYEGLSYAGLEALMFSKPGVLTDVDGNRDLIDNNINGFLVEANSNIFAKRIIELLNNRKLLFVMSEASKQKFETQFNIEKNIKLLEEIYKNLLE